VKYAKTSVDKNRFRKTKSVQRVLVALQYEKLLVTAS